MSGGPCGRGGVGNRLVVACRVVFVEEIELVLLLLLLLFILVLVEHGRAALDALGQVGLEEFRMGVEPGSHLAVAKLDTRGERGGRSHVFVVVHLWYRNAYLFTC